MEKMEDLQLAMIVARLYEADFENSSTCQGLLNEKVLGCNRDGSGYHCSRLHPDPFLRSIAYWITKDYTRALDTLLERIPKEDDENPGEQVEDTVFQIIYICGFWAIFTPPLLSFLPSLFRCDGEILQPCGV